MIARQRATLDDLVTIVGGGTPARDNPAFYGGPIPWVTPKDMKAWEITHSEITLTEAGLQNSPATLVPANSVLLVIRSGILKHTLPIGVNRVPVALNQDVKAFLCGDRIHPTFLARFMKSESRRILKWGRGTTAVNLPLEKLRKLSIPLPSFAEQTRIAHILDRASHLRAKTRFALTSIDELPAAIFIDTFGDPVSNPLAWPEVRLGEVGELERGVSSHRPRNAPELLGGRYPLIQTGDVSNAGGYIRTHHATYSDLGLRQSKLWPAGTLCITIAANIAKAGILTFDACFPDSVVGFRADEPETVEFVRGWLSLMQKAIEDSAPESAQKNINLAILRDLRVPLPPIARQREFAGRIRAIELVKSTYRDAFGELDSLFASLESRAFGSEP